MKGHSRSPVRPTVKWEFLASAIVMIGLIGGMAGCTVEADDTPTCPEGTYRDGEVCVRDNGGTTPNSVTDDAGNGDTNNSTPGDMGADADDAGMVELTLPLSIDDAEYVPSGYYGDGETPGAIVMGNDCPMRAGGQAGMCHDIVWTPGIGSQGFAGVFWQYPANNFGSEPGLVLPPGATQITFQAWGANGGEVVEFFSGLNVDVDGYRVGTGPVALTAAPTEYAMSLCDVEYDEVVSAFGWGAADSAVPVEFYVDDIVMSVADEPCDNGTTDITFPFWVDEVGYVPSGFFGDGETPGAVAMGNNCPMRSRPGALGNCHDATWNTGIGSAGFGGVFWQYPENNFGALPGLVLPPGVTEVKFDAWGVNGGEVIDFFAGTSPDVDGFVRRNDGVVLTAEPVEYEIDLTCVVYDDVANAFGWGAGGVATGSVSFFIDNIRWVNDGDSSGCAPGTGLSQPDWPDDDGSSAGAPGDE